MSEQKLAPIDFAHMKFQKTKDLWNVAPYPQDQFPSVTQETWQEVEPLLVGYMGKCQDACQLAKQQWQPTGWLNATTGRYANELGAPVGQAVRIVLRRRIDEIVIDAEISAYESR